jgi:hypothetical protein
MFNFYRFAMWKDFVAQRLEDHEVANGYGRTDGTELD